MVAIFKIGKISKIWSTIFCPQLLPLWPNFSLIAPRDLHLFKQTWNASFWTLKSGAHILGKIGLFWPNIFRNPVNIPFFRFYVKWTLWLHELTPKSMTKIGHFRHFLVYFFDKRDVLGKFRFSSYPVVFKREYLELRARFWHSVKSGWSITKSYFI